MGYVIVWDGIGCGYGFSKLQAWAMDVAPERNIIVSICSTLRAQRKNILISFFITIILLNDSCILGLFCIILSAPLSSLFRADGLCPSFYCVGILKYWWERKGGCKTWISIIAWRIKIIHSKSFGMIGSSSHCSTHIRTIYSWEPCCNWGTHLGSSDRHRSVSCPRVGRMLSFYLWTEAIVIKYLNEIEGK